MKFDDLLEEIGDFGIYQRRTFVFVCIPVIFSAFHKLGWVFLGAVPAHRCSIRQDEVYEENPIYNLPAAVLNASIPWDEQNLQWSRCHIFTVTDHNNSDHPSTVTCNSWVYDKSQYISTVVTEFDLVCDRNWLRALIHSLYLVGEFLGCTVLGYLSDRIGRKKILLLSLFGQGLCGILAGVFRNYYAFIVFRMLVGMFTHAMILACLILAMEFVGPTKRPIAGIAANYFFAVGYVATAGIAYICRDWPFFQIALSVPALLYVFAMRWVPESARWLISMKRTEEAMETIRKAAQVNNKILPETINLNSENEKSSGPKVKALDLFWNPSVRVKVLIMCFTWFVNSAVYYGLSLNTSNLGGNDYLNFLISAFVEIPAYSIAIVCMIYFGRRFPLCLSMVIGGIALLSTGFIPIDMKIAVTTLAMLGKLCISMSYSIIFVFAAEIYPTQVRNIAVGVNSTFSRLGSIATSFIVLLGDYWRPLPLIILGALSLTAGILSLCLPETHCKALPENFAEASQLMTASEDGLILRRPSKIHAVDGIELKPISKKLHSPKNNIGN